MMQYFLVISLRDRFTGSTTMRLFVEEKEQFERVKKDSQRYTDVAIRPVEPMEGYPRHFIDKDKCVYYDTGDEVKFVGFHDET